MLISPRQKAVCMRAPYSFIPAIFLSPCMNFGLTLDIVWLCMCGSWIFSRHPHSKKLLNSFSMTNTTMKKKKENEKKMLEWTTNVGKTVNQQQHTEHIPYGGVDLFVSDTEDRTISCVLNVLWTWRARIFPFSNQFKRCKYTVNECTN